METNNSMIEQAGKLYASGLQVDADYMTKQTGIPVSLIQAATPKPTKPLTNEVQNKLNDLYNGHKHQH
jgi:hypothetical protein